MNDYIKIKLVAWTAEIESLRAATSLAEFLQDYNTLADNKDRLREINQEILKLLGENEKV